MKHPNLRQHVQYQAEEFASWMLDYLGYDVRENGHNDHCDLVINGKLRVEVKGALWSSSSTREGRYQFNTRQHPDVYILRCLTIPGAAFIIPGREIGSRTNIAIWSRNPYKYNGQWAKYMNTWDVIRTELERKSSDENPD